MASLLKCKVAGCGFDALNEKDLKKHMEEDHKIKQEVQTLEQEVKDKEMADFKSLWEERTTLIIDLIELTRVDSTIDDIITDLKENSEDIAKSIFTVFKKDSESKSKEPKEDYYALLEISHPTRGYPLTQEEDVWMRNYMSVSMFIRILKDNITLLKDYFRYTKENDVEGQKIAEEGLGDSISSTTGFLKSMSDTWDLQIINKKLIQYLRNIKKMSVVLVSNKDDIDADTIEEQLEISREIATTLFKGMIEWKAKQSHQN